MVSKNGVALVILIASLFGVELTETHLIDVLGALSTLVSVSMMIWNQANRADVKGFIFKE